MPARHKIDASKAAQEQLANRAEKHLEQYLDRNVKPTKGEAALRKEVEPIQEQLAKLGKHAASLLGAVAGVADHHNPLTIIEHLDKIVSASSKHIPTILTPEGVKVEKGMEEIGAVFVDSLIKGGMGIEMRDDPPESARAISTIRRLAGFCILFTFGTSAFVSLGKMLLCERFPEALAETIGKLGEELGINWLLGQLLESIFENAVGQPLEEMINLQVHSRRFDMGTLRMLMRQHRISPEEAEKALDRLGWRKEDIASIIKLDVNQLPMNELQTAYVRGDMSREDIIPYLRFQGMSDGDIDILLKNYIEHAETAAEGEYRSVARAAFKEGTISESQFRQILKQVYTPDKAMDEEVAAINLSIQTERHNLSTSVLKWLWQNHSTSHEAVRNELRKQHYSDEQITELTSMWDDAPTHHAKELSPAKILLYQNSGVISKPEAYDRLLSLGYRSSDAHLLTDNPHAASVHHRLPYERGTIVGAYRHEVINQDQARRDLQSINVPDTEIDLELQAAAAYITTRHKTKVPHKHIGEGDIEWAVKLGVRGTNWAIDEFENLGYSPDDAILKTIIAYGRAKLDNPFGPTSSGNDAQNGQLGTAPFFPIDPTLPGSGTPIVVSDPRHTGGGTITKPPTTTPPRGTPAP